MENSIMSQAGGVLDSIAFDFRLNDEFYVRTRVERGSARGKVFYFVRNGDTAESSEGVCPLDALSRLADSLNALSSEETAEVACDCRLVINDTTEFHRLPAAVVKDIARMLAAEVDDLSFLRGLPVG